MKLSHYTILIPVRNTGKFLVYNTLSNTLVELGADQGQLLTRWEGLEHIDDIEFLSLPDDVKDVLVNDGFVCDNETDEQLEVRDRILNKKVEMYKAGYFSLTINTTNLCNMACPYCFQGEHLKKHDESNVFNRDSMEALISWMEEEIENPLTTEVKGVAVVWFGGEPLLKPQVVESLSARLLAFCDKHDISYEAKVITNGTHLTQKTWETLWNARVGSVQVTIDGDRITHEQSRPMLGGQKTYERILENLTHLPEGISVSIRVNTDKKVAETLPNLLDDLEAYGLWPHRAGQVALELAHKVSFEKDRHGPGSPYMTLKEFYEFKEEFRQYQWKRYNAWARKSGRSQAKMEMKYPTESGFHCGIASAPYAVSLDDNGYIHKCWETMNEKSGRIRHISEFDIMAEQAEKWMHFSKLDDPVCAECKYLPICDTTCPARHFGGDRACTEWKFVLPQRLEH